MNRHLRKLFATPSAVTAVFLGVGLAPAAQAGEVRLFGVDMNVSDTLASGTPTHALPGGQISHTQAGFEPLEVAYTTDQGNGDAGVAASFASQTLSNVGGTGIGVLVNSTGNTRDRGITGVPSPPFSSGGFFPAGANALGYLLQDSVSAAKLQLTGLLANTTYHLKTYGVDANGGQVNAYYLGSYSFGTGTGTGFVGGPVSNVGYEWAWGFGNSPLPLVNATTSSVLVLAPQTSSSGNTLATGAGVGMLDFTVTTAADFTGTFQFTTTGTFNGFEIYQVVAGGDYATWAAANAGGGMPAEDFNSDGVPNGIAYFMGATGLATNPGVVNGKVTWPHLGAVASFAVQVSADLTTWSQADPAAVDSTTDPTKVIFTLPLGATQQFCRLSVTP